MEWIGTSTEERRTVTGGIQRTESSRRGLLEGMEMVRVIRIVSLNINLGQAGCLESTLCALQKGNIGIGVLQETKMTGGVHTQYSLG